MNLPLINRVTIVGAGWVGRQIAAQLLAHGVHVHLNDANHQAIMSAQDWIAIHIAQQVASGDWSEDSAVGWEGRLTSSMQLEAIECDLVLECTFEQVSIKKRVLRQVSEVYPSPCIVASNSSYFVPSILSRYVNSPERYVHWHFHVPIWRSKIVDIVPCESTDESVLDRMKELSIRIDQIPVVQRVENPGYVFNALLRGMICSALDLADRKVASPVVIDQVWTTITKMEKGPFGIMDAIGLDVVQQSLSNGRWDNKAFDLDRFIAMLGEMIDQGRLGMKTGSGFFAYDESPKLDSND